MPEWQLVPWTKLGILGDQVRRGVLLGIRVGTALAWRAGAPGA